MVIEVAHQRVGQSARLVELVDEIGHRRAGQPVHLVELVDEVGWRSSSIGPPAELLDRDLVGGWAVFEGPILATQLLSTRQ